MRNVVLTGLRNEVDLRTGETTVFGLVFNAGELYIEVDQPTMKRVVEYAFGQSNGENTEHQEQVVPTPAVNEDSELQEAPLDEDDIPQL